jgi:hypothetical protein
MDSGSFTMRGEAMSIEAEIHTGRCLCGKVSFTVSGPLQAPDACHCSQCRRQSGHFWASTDVQHSAITISGTDDIRWFVSSAKVRRGFCATCGSALFWEPLGQTRIAVAMGAFDQPTGTKLESNIFVASKGDYYEIADGLPQHFE